MTARIELYTKSNCSFCLRAKALLDQKGLPYEEIRVDSSESALEEMIKRSHGKRTVPQIFINDVSIGGYDDLWHLEQTKQLDEKTK
jgi:glutaredoxin 3